MLRQALLSGSLTFSMLRSVRKEAAYSLHVRRHAHRSIQEVTPETDSPISQQRLAMQVS